MDILDILSTIFDFAWTVIRALCSLDVSLLGKKIFGVISIAQILGLALAYHMLKSFLAFFLRSGVDIMRSGLNFCLKHMYAWLQRVSGHFWGRITRTITYIRTNHLQPFLHKLKSR